MKTSHTTPALCILFLLAAACCAQDSPLPGKKPVDKPSPTPPAPTLSVEQKLAIRDAQHKLDAIEKQQKDLGLQILDLQSKIGGEQQRLGKSYQDAKAVLDKATADAAPGIDPKKWKLDPETLTFGAAPPVREAPLREAPQKSPAEEPEKTPAAAHSTPKKR